METFIKKTWCNRTLASTFPFFMSLVSQIGGQTTLSYNEMKTIWGENWR